jgi:hypothetical protein
VRRTSTRFVTLNRVGMVLWLPLNIRISPKRSTASMKRRLSRSYGQTRLEDSRTRSAALAAQSSVSAQTKKLISYISPESAEIAAAYAHGGWADHNYRIQLGAPLIRAGREFVHERMLLDRRGLERQRIQIEFLNAFQLRSFIAFEFVPGEIGGCVERVTAQVEDWEISELERVNHHIKRIGAIASARGAMFAKGIETGLDQMRAGAILLDWRGRIVSMNARAASIRDRVFHIQSGQLPPRNTEMAGAFGRMLQGVGPGSRARDRPGRSSSPPLRGRIVGPCPRRSSGRRSISSCAHASSSCSLRFRRGASKASIAFAACLD